MNMPVVNREVSYEIAVVDNDNGLSAMSSQWQAVENLDSEATPFNSYDWLSLWWKHYKCADFKLHILQFSEQGRVVAIAPMYLRTNVQIRLFEQRELRWLGSGGDTSPDYLNIVCVDEHRNAVIPRFINYLVEFDGAQRFHFSDMLTATALRKQLQNTFAARKVFLFSTPTKIILKADLPSTWDEYRMALSRKRRKQINHRRNRLDQAGDWSLHVCVSDEERHHAVKALENLHRQRWVSKGQAGSFASDAYVDFHREIIKTFANNNQLWLVTLTLDGNIIGVLYLFLWRNSLLFFQSGFSPEHESLSPGHVMFTYVIGEAIERGIGHIDLLKGDYPYKKVYAKSKSETNDLVFMRPGLGCYIERSKRFLKPYLS